MVRKGIGLKRAEQPHDSVRVLRSARQGYWHVGALIKGGFLASVLYLHTGDEAAEINSGMLFQLGGTLRAMSI
eukprot:9221494-Heterocapsa_arctica.AAC.1